MKKLLLTLLALVGLLTIASAQYEIYQIRYYLYSAGTPALSAWYADEETFGLTDSGDGPEMAYWNPTNIPAPAITNLPDWKTSLRWYAANRPTLPSEATFTGLLYQVGVTNIQGDPLYPGRFAGIYNGLMYQVQTETNIAVMLELHTLSIALDATYQELRRHLEDAIYSPWLGSTNCLMTGPIP